MTIADIAEYIHMYVGGRGATWNLTDHEVVRNVIVRIGTYWSYWAEQRAYMYV